MQNNNFKRFLVDEDEVIVDLDCLIFIDGFASFMSSKRISNDMYAVYTAVLNESYEIVVPFRKQILTKAQYENTDCKVLVVVYEGKKAIFQTKDYFYVINLQNIKFKKESYEYIPCDYINKFISYYNMGNGKIIAYEQETAYIYDVVNGKINGFICDYMEPSNRYKDCYEAFISLKQNGIITLMVRMMFDDNGNAKDAVFVNDSIIAYPLIDCFDDKDKLLKYCDDCYNEYINMGDMLCKTVS